MQKAKRNKNKGVRSACVWGVRLLALMLNRRPSNLGQTLIKKKKSKLSCVKCIAYNILVNWRFRKQRKPLHVFLFKYSNSYLINKIKKKKDTFCSSKRKQLKVK